MGKDNATTACRNILSLCDGYNCAFGNDYRYCCMLEAGHSGPHYDEFQVDEKTVVIAWHPEPFRVAIAKEE